MSGEHNLGELLADMSPELIDGEFVFVSLAGGQYGEHSELQPLASIREAEGLTLIIPIDQADRCGMKYDGVFRMISLRVHSSLDAVGLTAAFAGKLAEHGISANVVAGFYHDHIFVPRKLAERALSALQELTV